MSEGELVEWVSPGVAMREAVVTDPQIGDLVPPAHDFQHGGIGSGVARSPHHQDGKPFVAVMLRAKDGTHYPAMLTAAIARNFAADLLEAAELAESGQ